MEILRFDNEKPRDARNVEKTILFLFNLEKVDPSIVKNVFERSGKKGA